MSFADILGIAGLVVGIAGFGVTIYQVVEARKAAQDAVGIARATQQAVERTERLRALLELMAVVPNMQRFERDLGQAVRNKNRTAVENHLQDWRNLAAETRGLLEKQTFDSSSFEARLHESSSAAAQAISLLDTSDIATATKWVITMISSTTEEAAAVMGRLKAHPALPEVGPT